MVTENVKSVYGLQGVQRFTHRLGDSNMHCHGRHGILLGFDETKFRCRVWSFSRWKFLEFTDGGTEV